MVKISMKNTATMRLSGTPAVYPDVVVRGKISRRDRGDHEICIRKYDSTVTPKGAGTGLVGSSVPMEHGIMIDTTLMNQILEVDEENLTVTVEPGVLLMELSPMLKI